MRVLGIIPARAGSRRCPGKNTADLGGIPLIAWTIKTAQQSYAFNDLVVTTDDPEVVQIANEQRCNVVQRPAELTGPEVPMLPVVLHTMRYIEADIVVLLQPTSPFRVIADIDRSIALLKATNGDAVISVTDAPEDLAFELGHADRMRPSHSVVVPNGALYLVTSQHLMSGGTWYSGITYAYKMPKDRSLDIDTTVDLEIARMLVQTGKIRREC